MAVREKSENIEVDSFHEAICAVVFCQICIGIAKQSPGRV